MAMNRFIEVTLKLFLIAFFGLFISGAGMFSADSGELATDKNVKNTEPLAEIEGFRSAKFKMSMDQVKQAIYQDFKLGDDKIDTIKHPTEKTNSLAVTVENILPDSGKSRVVYVFGYKTKALIQVNILMGHPVDKDATPQQIVDSGNMLGKFLDEDLNHREVVAETISPLASESGYYHTSIVTPTVLQVTRRHFNW